MKFCLITPFNHLDLSEMGDMYFALTKEGVTNKTYREFFLTKKLGGFDVIVDNNIHENDAVDWEQHVELAKEVGTILIVPDEMRNMNVTLKNFDSFMDKYYDELKEAGVKIMAVPQGQNITEIDFCFHKFNNDPRVDFIGHSFDLEPYKYNNLSKYQRQSINRLIVVGKWVESCKKKIHLLGCNNLSELYYLSKFDCINSTDGKFLSRISLANIELTPTNWLGVEKHNDVKMKFDSYLTSYQQDLFETNFKFIKSIIE